MVTLMTRVPTISGKAFFISLALMVVGCQASPTVISGFGDTRGRSYPHTGTDYAVPWGTPVLAALGGVVTMAMCNSDDVTDGGGHAIFIRHDNNYTTYYMHLMKVFVVAGQDVQRGEVIALSGKTGRNVGPKPHLHFQVLNYGNIDPYPDHWYGGKGVPLAYDPVISYPPDAGLTHPMAFGSYRSAAREMAKELGKRFRNGKSTKPAPDKTAKQDFPKVFEIFLELNEPRREAKRDSLPC